jgi:ribosomal protein RSM22 (predicted rRNA methylase)
MLPQSIAQSVTNWIEGNHSGSHRKGAEKLTTAYRAGGTSANADVAAYLVSRAPATFAAVQRVLSELALQMPAFAPHSLLDIGCGPGTGSWAAVSQWPQLQRVTMLDSNAGFLSAARAIANNSGIAALTSANYLSASLQDTSASADVVLASYVFAERPESEAGQLARKLWLAGTQVFIAIEPGTPKGFARIRAIRDSLIASGAHVIAPCPHEHVCPMTGEDWCHFSVRLARSRPHMHAKNASLPFEDEPLSYIAFSRAPVVWPQARVIARTKESKHDVFFKLCTSRGVETVSIASRNKAAYKHARKLDWGDAFTLNNNG